MVYDPFSRKRVSKDRHMLRLRHQSKVLYHFSKYSGRILYFGGITRPLGLRFSD